LIGFWPLGNNPDPQYVRNWLDGVQSKQAVASSARFNTITEHGRALDATSSIRGYEVRSADFTYKPGFSFAASLNFTTVTDQTIFMIQSISELSMWADNFGGTLRIATQPGGPYYGTDGELLGRHVHGVSYKSGVGKEFFIDGKNTASPSSVATFSGSLKTIYILGAVTSKYTYDGNEWVALWDA